MDGSLSGPEGAEEGMSSSESGWTMYIVSPTEDEGEDGIAVEEEGSSGVSWARGKNKTIRRDNIKREEDSDDSMASDASSSGKSHHHHLHHQKKIIGSKKATEEEEERKWSFSKAKVKKKGRDKPPK
ncbi:hypothetical protein SAY87_014121 [Trapa incisa]|uniref:Uncharacterized protein n=2 Tax=Trapa TaxID=22665 RepID=A0AAN7M5I8_TRANT|nr:hypothetical protein SAY87_014121 [Trapa incisa]KAK4803263.1 hypothetical protein SAY86_001466 [Trapa natans]